MLKFKYCFIIAVLYSLILTFYSCSQNEGKEMYYYESGSVKEQFSISDGLRNGEYLSYYEDGSIRSRGNYSNGLEDGTFVFYYPNGVKLNEGNSKKGLRVGIYRSYDQGGALRRMDFYDENGNALYYKMYMPDGSRDFSSGTKKALFIPLLDTLEIDKEYQFQIKLGNAQFERIEVKIGNPRNKKTLLLPSLTNQDDSTAIINFSPKNLGDTSVTGVILDLKGVAEKFDLTTFKHNFYIVE